MNIERNFRHAHDLPPMTPAEMSAQPAIHPRRLLEWGVFFATVVVVLLLIALSVATKSPAHSNDRRVIGMPAVGSTVSPESLDLAFEKHVETETKALCKFEWRLVRSSMVPERAMICKRGRA